jgi:type I restriction enzyme R subunit
VGSYAGEIVDACTATGLPRPAVRIYRDPFRTEVRSIKYRNIAAGLLDKLLKDALKVRATRDLVQASMFSEKLHETLNSYRNCAISKKQVIDDKL